MTLALAACLLVPATTVADTLDGVDAYSELLRFRFSKVGPASALQHDTATFVNPMLVDPASPYSDTQPQPALTNETWWPEFVDTVGRKHRPDAPSGLWDDILHTLHWDMGLTKARPGIELGHHVDSPQQWLPYKDQRIAASAIKAAVDPDIFYQALDMTGSHHSTTAAGYAVALQVLRDSLARTPVERQASQGLRADVLARYMRASSPQSISENDEQYLSLMLRRELHRWQAGSAAKTGLRELPAMYRVARVAAAYRDRAGYVAGSYCRADFSPDPRVAGELTGTDNRPLCFVAATDRAVLAWFRGELRAQAKGLPNQHHHDGVKDFMHWMGGVLAVLDFAAFAEVTEALISDAMLEEGALEEEDAAIATERARTLTCRIRS